MVSFTLRTTSTLFLAAFSAINVQAVPLSLTKRIAQIISASTQQWEQACDKAGGGLDCNPTSVSAFQTLLINAGVCAQQDAADTMVDLAKKQNNDPDMIRLTQIFAQQARNSPNSLAVPYCQKAPRNAELQGLFQCQFQGSNQQSFVGGLKVGDNGTIPFGMTQPVNPLGSCLAHPQGPIADGSQLVDQVQDPGVGGGSNSTASATSSSGDATPSNIATATNDGTASTTVASAPASTATSTETASGTSVDNSSASSTASAPTTSSTSTAAGDEGSDDIDPSATSSSTPPSASSDGSVRASNGSTDSSSGAASSDFHIQNGLDAQKLNASFKSLTADSSCNEGDQACVQGGFAQCVSGKFVITQCSGGLTCEALPLVAKPGTSLACTTEADALSRIQATGATGGIDGS